MSGGPGPWCRITATGERWREPGWRSDAGACSTDTSPAAPDVPAGQGPEFGRRGRYSVPAPWSGGGCASAPACLPPGGWGRGARTLAPAAPGPSPGGRRIDDDSRWRPDPRSRTCLIAGPVPLALFQKLGVRSRCECRHLDLAAIDAADVRGGTSAHAPSASRRGRSGVMAAPKSNAVCGGRQLLGQAYPVRRTAGGVTATVTSGPPPLL
jgi:hypothetical protein